MSGNQRIGGPIEVQAGGVRFIVKPGATYNLGVSKRSAIAGAKVMAGYKEEPQVSFIEFEAVDKRTLDVKEVLRMEDKTVTATVPNGKTILFHNAYYAGEGTLSVDEGNLGCRFESLQEAEEI